MRRCLALASTVLVLGIGTLAHADELEPHWQVEANLPLLTPPPPPTDASTMTPPRETTTFYGWENIAISYAGAGIFWGGIAADSKSVPWAGLGVYALGSPLVHLAHGQPLRAAGSLAINAFVPLLAGAIGNALMPPVSAQATPGSSDVVPAGLLLGMFIGSLAAPLIDGLTLGWESHPSSPLASMTPTVSIARKEDPLSMNSIGVAGIF